MDKWLLGDLLVKHKIAVNKTSADFVLFVC